MQYVYQLIISAHVSKLQLYRISAYTPRTLLILGSACLTAGQKYS